MDSIVKSLKMAWNHFDDVFGMSEQLLSCGSWNDQL